MRRLDKAVFKQLPGLMDANIILRQQPQAKLDFVDRGMVGDALRKLLPSGRIQIAAELNTLICILDSNDLAIHQRALKTLKRGWQLLAGCYRGTTVYVLPPITNRRTDLKQMFFRLLSTEAGVGNLFLAQELAGQIPAGGQKRRLGKDVARWVATDLVALLKNDALNKTVARIYRGSFVKRNDVSFLDPPLTVGVSETIEEKAEAFNPLLATERSSPVSMNVSWGIASSWSI
ncbi:MAG: hypothetical protein JO266_05035 [Acidobacteria bacterium]|nr:hypothetical protein [Acidobacteriota bacterium]